MADGSLPIVVTPEPFGRDAFDLTVVEGLTVRAMLVEAVKAGLPIEALNRTEIYIDGGRLDRETALDHVLTADQVVNVVVEPMGGGGGRKDIGQILLTVAVIAVSAWVGGGAGGMITKEIFARAAAAAITLGGQALIGALYAPDSKAAKANDRYALQSASNQYRQWGPMPLAQGEVVTAPDLAAKTFTQSQGDDVWMYGILGVHYGPCEVSEVKIGDTLVSTMGPGDFRMVQHLEPGPRTFQLYPNDVDQLDLNEELQATPSSATPLIRAASSDGSRFDIDLFLPAGLCFQKDDGRLLTAHASVAVRYRPIDQTGAATGPWQTAPGWARTSATKDPIRVTHPVHLPHGRYEFDLTRNRPDDDNDKRRDTVMVTAIKAVAFRKPVTDETLSIIEFAVRATAINQGGLAPITCRIKPKCSTWTGSAWGPPVATSNPAALARWLMTGPAPAKPLLSAQADARLRVWHQLCEQYDWTCHLYLAEARTQSEALAILERAGRAGVFWDGTQLAASPWVEKPIPTQVFTDDNLKDHRWEIVYSDPVHALRVEFQNIEKGGEPDELFVYNDGYGETADPATGIKAASLIEALTLDGQATPNRAYRDGRWKLGQRRHQRRIDTWTADLEHLISQYGSRVRLAWNRAGGGSARVRCRRWSEDGAAVVGLRLSAPVEMVAGLSYAVDLRTKGGLYDGVPIQTRPGVTREILFTSARHPDVCPAAGDLIAFGEVEKVSEDVEIIAIEPGENLTAVLTGVRYVAPLLMAGETGPIPPLTSSLSGDRQADPPRPTLLGVQADAHAVRVSFDMPTWRGAPLSGFVVRWRSKTAAGEPGAWGALPALDAAARELRTPPLREAPGEGEAATRAEIEITATTVDGRASKPLTLTVSLPVPALPGRWSVEPKLAAEDGSSQPILIVTGEVDDPAVAAVKAAWSLTPHGPWNDVYQGAPSIRALEIAGLTAGVDHYVAITYLSAQGVPGDFLVIGPSVPGELIAGGLAPAAAEKVVDEVLDLLGEASGDTEEARKGAELTLKTILNEHQALEAEARTRLEADTGVLNEARFFTEGAVAGAMNLVYVKAEADARIASALQVAKADTDALRSEAQLLFATKTERENGDAAAAFQARAYTDALRSDASVIYATQAAMGAGLAATLNEAMSFTNGQIATSMNLVYNKAQVDGALATTLQQARAHTDAVRSESELLYATKVERANGDAQTLQQAKSALDDYKSQAEMIFASQAGLNGVSATAALALQAAVDAQDQLGEAAFSLVASSGGDPAMIYGKAKGGSSVVGMAASVLRFANVIGGAVVDVMKIIGGSVYITGKLFMGAAGQIELDPTYPLILWKFGNARLAIGQLPNDNLFFWFGPGASTAVTAMRKNNAKVWFDTSGNSYWGGSIIAGTISNSGQGTLITVPASFTLGPFATNGGPITIVWSYDYSRQGKRWGNQTGGISGSTTALVRLYRKIGAAAEELLDSMSVTGTINAQYDAEPVPGQPSGTQGQTFFTEYMGASRTFTDNAGGVQQRTYRIEVASRSLRSVPGDSNELDDQRQAYGVTSSE